MISIFDEDSSCPDFIEKRYDHFAYSPLHHEESTSICYNDRENDKIMRHFSLDHIFDSKLRIEFHI